MPEGHTLHRLALDLSRDLLGNVVAVSSPQGRFDGATRLDGCKLTGTEAVGKHLLLRFGRAGVVHIHLGLFGRFYRRRHPAPLPRSTTRMRLTVPDWTWDLVGPTRCELLSARGVRALRERLGADPLAPGANVEAAWQTLSRSHRSIAAVLLDQSVFAGIGNVYRAELLHLVRLHPETPASRLGRAKFDELWALARQLLAAGVREKRIVTVPHEGRRRVRRDEALHVYGRTACHTCGERVTVTRNANRPMYACERCQPLDLG
ncbi:MAG: Fpg/Nei family DNA glycosylase [Deltaproteobacteria bacterium]|nr:Fpg/Nei family DNA glycosylase [Deltaproteobacteria bacterium]